jgi:hypothetical protein
MISQSLPMSRSTAALVFMLCLPLVRRPAGIAAIIRPFGPRIYIAGPKTAARTFGLPDQSLTRP